MKSEKTEKGYSGKHWKATMKSSQKGSGRPKEWNAIPPDPLGAYKETAKITALDAMLAIIKI